MFCTQCGKQLPEGSVSCTVCGHRRKRSQEDGAYMDSSAAIPKVEVNNHSPSGLPEIEVNNHSPSGLPEIEINNRSPSGLP